MQLHRTRDAAANRDKALRRLRRITATSQATASTTTTPSDDRRHRGIGEQLVGQQHHGHLVVDIDEFQPVIADHAAGGEPEQLELRAGGDRRIGTRMNRTARALTAG